MKPGYAGVALYSKEKPLSVKKGLGKPEHDEEGRVITAEYEKFYVVGTCNYKFFFLNFNLTHLKKIILSLSGVLNVKVQQFTTANI